MSTVTIEICLGKSCTVEGRYPELSQVGKGVPCMIICPIERVAWRSTATLPIPGARWCTRIACPDEATEFIITEILSFSPSSSGLSRDCRVNGGRSEDIAHRVVGTTTLEDGCPTLL